MERVLISLILLWVVQTIGAQEKDISELTLEDKTCIIHRGWLTLKFGQKILDFELN